MMLTCWVGDRYTMAFSDSPRFLLKSTDYHSETTCESFETAAALVERMQALSAEWWPSDKVVLFTQADLDLFLATERLRRVMYADEITDYTGRLPFRYQVARPVPEGQISFFDESDW